MSRFFFAVSDDHAQFLFVGFLSGRDERFLLLPVDKRADTSDEHDCDHDSETLNPSMGFIVFISKNHIECYRENCSHNQDLKHEVIKSGKEEGRPGLSLQGCFPIVSKRVVPF